MKFSQRLGGTRKRSDVAEQLLILAWSIVDRFRTVVTQQLRDELIASHSHEPVNGVHRRPFTRRPKRP
jgi:hypothetical protein